MRKRKISEAEVEAVLESPEITYPSHEPGKTLLIRTLGKRRIVAVVPDADHERVITTYDQLDEDQ